MKKARTIVPLAALAILASVLLQSPSAQAPSGTEKQDRSGPAESHAGSTARPVSGPDDPFNALDVLAESFGVDVSRDGLKRMVTREARFSRSETMNERWREALEFLDDLPAPLKVPAFDPSDRGDADTLGRAIARAFDQDPPLDTTDLRFRALRHVAKRQNTDVGFLIATLPDPIDSFTGWQFDPMLDAISQAVSASDYIFERFRFPDSEPDGRGREARGRAHENESSVVLYRRHIEIQFPEAGTEGLAAPRPRERQILVLLIVHENPSAGVHATALVNAIRVVTKWFGRDPLAHESTIRILGPTFSGSADSIARDLAQADRRRLLDNYTVRFVSGSATDETNKDVLEGAVPGRVDPAENGWPPETPEPRVTFHATVQSDRALLPVLIDQVKQAQWPLPIAVLFEGNTQYGRSLIQALTQTGSLLPSEMIMLPFPMNISRLRDTPQDDKAGLAGALGLPSKFRPLPMESVGKPADQIPQLWPKTTSSYVELAISGILQTMRTEHIGTVALMATDPRDKLFLARQIRRDSPNVCILTAESDSLYVHPDYSSYLHGALVASTYPLYSGNQRWSYGFQGGTERREFSSGSAKGIYNAALALLNFDRDGNPVRPSGDHSWEKPQLLEYGAPGQDCSQGCEPPIWISVIGRHSSWPMQVRRGPPSDYVLRIQSDDPPPTRLATFPSVSFTVVAVSLTGLVLVCWAGLRTAWWGRATGFRCRLATLVTGGGPEPGRAFLLVAVVSLLTVEAYLAAVSVTRFRLDASSWSEPSFWSGAAAVMIVLAVVALVDLASHILRRMMIHDRAALRQQFSLSTAAGWARLVVVIFCAGTAISLLAYAWAQTFQSRQEAVSFATRAVDLGSGVSPTLPVLFLCAALMLWSLAELARLRSPAVALTDPAVRPLMQQTMSGDLERMTRDWDLLNRSTVAVPRALAIIAPILVIATCLFLFDPIVRPLVTIDGPWFGRFVSASILIVQVMITLSLLQFVYLWIVLKHLLQRIASHSPAHAYEQIPRALFPAGLFPSLPTLMEIEIIVQHWHASLGRSGQANQAVALRDSFAKEMAMPRSPYWSSSQTWQSLVKAAGVRVGQPGMPTPADQATLEEMCAALVVRDAIARLWHNLVFVIGGVLFVFCSHTQFPFQIQQHLSELGWMYVAATFGAILMVLIQMKRNDILHRLTAVDPTQRTGWDTSFVWQVAVFALLPLLTLFTAQFPNAGQVLLKWVDPMRQLLP